MGEKSSINKVHKEDQSSHKALGEKSDDGLNCIDSEFILRRNWALGRAKRYSFQGHSNNLVTCLQFDNDKIISGSDDNCINVYDTATGSLRNRLKGHEGGVWALQFDGNILVSGSTDRTLRVWNIEQAKCTHVFRGHTSTVRCLVLSLPTAIVQPDGTRVMEPSMPLIVTGSRDTTLRVWKLPDIDNGLCTEEHDSSQFPNDSDPHLLHVLTGHSDSVRTIAVMGNTIVSGSYDHTLRVWDLATGTCQFVLEGHTQKVYTVAMTPDRRACISGSFEGVLRIWSLLDGSCLATLEGHTSLVGLLEVSRNYIVSASADGTLRVWDMESHECRHVLEEHRSAVTCFQHDDTKIISGAEGGIKMWDISTGQHVCDLLTNVQGVWQLAFDERRCIAAVHRGKLSERLTWFEVFDYGVYGFEEELAGE
ncbi:uncharacterized protein VTP21DRAFT_387 [Calcarisporiella thermophila]|uniref:uncharacterized protein n=1 Tax=Calcarisporiella thermophila TaxID=911321 RepID=UPI003743CF3B